MKRKRAPKDDYQTVIRAIVYQCTARKLLRVTPEQAKLLAEATEADPPKVVSFLFSALVDWLEQYKSTGPRLSVLFPYLLQQDQKCLVTLFLCCKANKVPRDVRNIITRYILHESVIWWAEHKYLYCRFYSLFTVVYCWSQLKVETDQLDEALFLKHLEFIFYERRISVRFLLTELIRRFSRTEHLLII